MMKNFLSPKKKKSSGDDAAEPNGEGRTRPTRTKSQLQAMNLDNSNHNSEEANGKFRRRRSLQDDQANTEKSEVSPQPKSPQNKRSSRMSGKIGGLFGMKKSPPRTSLATDPGEAEMDDLGKQEHLDAIFKKKQQAAMQEERGNAAEAGAETRKVRKKSVTSTETPESAAAADNRSRRRGRSLTNLGETAQGVDDNERQSAVGTADRKSSKGRRTSLRNSQQQQPTDPNTEAAERRSRRGRRSITNPMEPTRKTSPKRPEDVDVESNANSGVQNSASRAEESNATRQQQQKQQQQQPESAKEGRRTARGSRSIAVSMNLSENSDRKAKNEISVSRPKQRKNDAQLNAAGGMDNTRRVPVKSMNKKTKEEVGKVPLQRSTEVKTQGASALSTPSSPDRMSRRGNRSIITAIEGMDAPNQENKVEDGVGVLNSATRKSPSEPSKTPENPSVSGESGVGTLPSSSGHNAPGSSTASASLREDSISGSNHAAPNPKARKSLESRRKSSRRLVDSGENRRDEYASRSSIRKDSAAGLARQGKSFRRRRESEVERSGSRSRSSLRKSQSTRRLDGDDRPKLSRAKSKTRMSMSSKGPDRKKEGRDRDRPKNRDKDRDRERGKDRNRERDRERRDRDRDRDRERSRDREDRRRRSMHRDASRKHSLLGESGEESRPSVSRSSSTETLDEFLQQMRSGSQSKPADERSRSLQSSTNSEKRDRSHRRSSKAPRSEKSKKLGNFLRDGEQDKPRQSRESRSTFTSIRKAKKSNPLPRSKDEAIRLLKSASHTVDDQRKDRRESRRVDGVKRASEMSSKALPEEEQPDRDGTATGSQIESRALAEGTANPQKSVSTESLPFVPPSSQSKDSARASDSKLLGEHTGLQLIQTDNFQSLSSIGESQPVLPVELNSTLLGTGYGDCEKSSVNPDASGFNEETPMNGKVARRSDDGGHEETRSSDLANAASIGSDGSDDDSKIEVNKAIKLNFTDVEEDACDSAVATLDDDSAATCKDTEKPSTDEAKDDSKRGRRGIFAAFRESISTRFLSGSSEAKYESFLGVDPKAEAEDDDTTNVRSPDVIVDDDAMQNQPDGVMNDLPDLSAPSVAIRQNENSTSAVEAESSSSEFEKGQAAPDVESELGNSWKATSEELVDGTQNIKTANSSVSEIERDECSMQGTKSGSSSFSDIANDSEILERQHSGVIDSAGFTVDKQSSSVNPPSTDSQTFSDIEGGRDNVSDEAGGERLSTRADGYAEIGAVETITSPNPILESAVGKMRSDSASDREVHQIPADDVNASTEDEKPTQHIHGSTPEERLSSPNLRDECEMDFVAEDKETLPQGYTPAVPDEAFDGSVPNSSAVSIGSNSSSELSYLSEHNEVSNDAFVGGPDTEKPLNDAKETPIDALRAEPQQGVVVEDAGFEISDQTSQEYDVEESPESQHHNEQDNLEKYSDAASEDSHFEEPSVTELDRGAVIKDEALEGFRVYSENLDTEDQSLEEQSIDATHGNGDMDTELSNENVVAAKSDLFAGQPSCELYLEREAHHVQEHYPEATPTHGETEEDVGNEEGEASLEATPKEHINLANESKERDADGQNPVHERVLKGGDIEAHFEDGHVESEHEEHEPETHKAAPHTPSDGTTDEKFMATQPASDSSVLLEHEHSQTTLREGQGSVQSIEALGHNSDGSSGYPKEEELREEMLQTVPMKDEISSNVKEMDLEEGGMDDQLPADDERNAIGMVETEDVEQERSRRSRRTQQRSIESISNEDGNHSKTLPERQLKTWKSVRRMSKRGQDTQRRRSSRRGQSGRDSSPHKSSRRRKQTEPDSPGSRVSTWRPPSTKKNKPDRRAQMRKSKSKRFRSSRVVLEEPEDTTPVDYYEEDLFVLYAWSTNRQETEKIQRQRLMLKNSIRRSAFYRTFESISAECNDNV